MLEGVAELVFVVGEKVSHSPDVLRVAARGSGFEDFLPEFYFSAISSF
jgi:hypothetical protein